MISQRIKRIEQVIGFNQPKKMWQEIPVIPVTQGVTDYWHNKGLPVPLLAGLSKGYDKGVSNDL